MPLFEVELSDGRVIELEADAAPSEADVMSALESYQPAKPTKETLQAEKVSLEKSGKSSRAGVMATGALELVGDFLANIPANVMNIPQAIDKATGLEPMETPFRFQRGTPMIPEMLPSTGDLTAKLEAIAGTTRGGSEIPDANAELIAGILKGAEDLVRGVSTPEVAMTAGGGAVPGAVRQTVARAVPTVFAEQMITHTPEAYSEFGRSSAEGTRAEAIRSGIGAVGSSAMISGIAAHEVRGQFPKVERNTVADAIEAELGGTVVPREPLLLPERTGPIITPPPEPPQSLRQTLSKAEDLFYELNRRKEAAKAEGDAVALVESSKRIAALSKEQGTAPEQQTAPTVVENAPAPPAPELSESVSSIKKQLGVNDGEALSLLAAESRSDQIELIKTYLKRRGIEVESKTNKAKQGTHDEAVESAVSESIQFFAENVPGPKSYEASLAREAIKNREARVNEPPSKYPNQGVGSPADEFGAVYGPSLSKSQQTRFSEQSGHEFKLDSPKGTSMVLKVKPTMLWLEASQKVGTGGMEDVAVAYLKIRNDGTTVLDASHHGRPLDQLAANKLIEFLQQSTSEKQAAQSPVSQIEQNREARVNEPPTPQPESAVAALSTEPAGPVKTTVTPEVTEASGAKAPETGGVKTLDALERLDASLKGRLEEIRKEGRLRALGDPEVAMIHAVRGAVKIAKGVKDFAVWSAEMVKEFGEAIKPQLEALWSRANAIVEGRDPIALSQRGMKMIADEGMPQAVRDQINPAYRVLTDKEATDAAKTIVGQSDPIEAANQWASGGYSDYAGKVQTAIGIELNRKLSATEQSLRKQGKTKEADAVVQTQLALAQKDIQNATNAGQTVQAFSMNYANWSPAAWLKHYLETVGKVASQRMKRATGRDVPVDPVETGKAAAEAVATEVGKTHPKLGETIRKVYGKGEDTVQGHLEKTGTPKSKSKTAAKKVEDFYQKEIKKWKKRHNIPEFDKETEAWLVQEANRINQMPEGSVQRRVAGQNLFNAIARKTGFKWWELSMDFWYANALSGPTTHVANAIGNSINMAAETSLMMLRNPTAIPQAIEAFGRALPKSARGAANILRTGHDYTGRHGSKFESPGVMELISNPTARALTAPWRMVLRGLKAADIAFFYPLQESRGVVLARAANRDIPLYGGGRAKKARELMAWNAEARAAAEAQAKAENVSPKLFNQRVDEILESKRPPQLQENAQEYAFHGTFNNDMYGVAGALGESLNSFFNRVPLVKPFVMPFVRIPINMFNSGLNWTPVGAYRAGRAQGHKLLVGKEENTGKLYGKEVKDPQAIGDLYAKSIVGTLGFTGLAAAAGQYLFDENPQFAINGAGPSDFNQRKQLRSAGWIPHSVKVGDRYYSYQDTIAAIPLAIIGEYYDAVKYRKMDQASALDRALVAFATSKSVILDSSWLQGLSAIFGRGSEVNVKHPGKGLMEQATRTGSKFVIPNAVNQIDRYFDPTVYKDPEVQGILMREIPFARKNLAPDLNVLGDPVMSPISKRFSSKEETGSLIQMLSSRRLWPSVPVDGELSVDEHYALMLTRGPLLKASIVENMADLMTLPRAEAQELLSQISESATREAKQQLGLQALEKERKTIRKLNTR